jgi:hypothetical protein
MSRGVISTVWPAPSICFSSTQPDADASAGRSSAPPPDPRFPDEQRRRATGAGACEPEVPERPEARCGLPRGERGELARSSPGRESRLEPIRAPTGARELRRALRPEIRDGLALVEEAEGGDQHETPQRGVREGRHLRRERRAYRRTDEVRTLETARLEQVERRCDPVRDVVEPVVPEGSGEAGQRGRDDAPTLREAIQEGRPAREPAQAAEEAERLPLALLPDAAALAAHAHYALGGCAHCASPRGVARSSRGIGRGHQWSSKRSSKRSAS